MSAVAVAALFAALFAGRLPGALRDRACQGREWRRAFPEAPKSEIREFLSVVASAFLFSRNQRLKLSPNDQLIAIYRARYPVEGWPDALELETLARDIRARYGVDLDSDWNDQLTLGALFHQARLPIGK